MIESERHICKNFCDLYNHNTASCPEKAKEICKEFDSKTDSTWHYFKLERWDE